MDVWGGAINGVSQTIVSFGALFVWTYIVVIGERHRTWVWFAWVVTLAYAIQSLTFIDAIGGDVARSVSFLARSFLLGSGAVVAATRLVIWLRRRRLLSR